MRLAGQLFIGMLIFASSVLGIVLMCKLGTCENSDKHCEKEKEENQK